MFKSARWRSEKNKVKSVFKLQFHATQVSQLGVDSLTVSVIPVDIGKPSVKLEKTSVKDGGCRWENPVYETVKFFREPRTGKITEKIYRFSVANGSAKNGILGEASIDFAAYTEANKASTVSLPLKSSNSEAILHVMIQRLQGDVDQREVEECDDIKPKAQDRSLKTHLSNGHIDEILAIDGPISKTTNHNGELNGNHRASSGSDLTFSSSDSSSGVNTPREHGLRNGDVHQEPPSYLSSLSNSSVPQKKVEQALMTDNDHQRLQWEWAGGSEHGVGTEDPTQSSRNTLTRENSQPALDSEVDKLKAELGVLARQANMSELELQTLRKQIIKEGKRGVDLSREVACLKEERDGYKTECERLKSLQTRSDDAKAKNRLSLGDGDLRTLVEEIRQELNHEKNLNSNLKLQLEKTQEANAELILAIQDLEEMLEQKDKEMADNVMRPRESVGKCESDEDEEQKALEKLVKEHRDANETLMLEQKITDLYNEIEIYRRDRDEFEMQMEQLALDYEILKQENHDISYKLEQSQIQEQLKMQYECSPINELTSHIESLEKELKARSRELSNSSTTIGELESRIKSLEEELKTRSKEKTDSLVTLKELESRITSLNEELKVREKQSSDSYTTIMELKSRIASLDEKLKMREEECSDYSATIKKLESHIGSFDEELKRQSKEHSDALETIKELKSHIKSLEEEVSESSLTIKGLESHIEGMHEELKKRSKEYADSSATISELEVHIRSLEEEFEERQHEFETDLDALMVAKVEQERRAIRAEESLRKMRWKNAGTAEKLQEEFRRLSMQMASTFEANEKVAMKSIQEAGELRAQKTQLEEMLKKAEGVLLAVKDDHEAKMCALRAKIERLETVNNCTTRQTEENGGPIAELEKLKKLVEENEMAIEKGNVERNTLKKEAESFLEELNRLKNLEDDKERLQSELEKLKARCNSLENSLTEDGVEKEKLRKQVLQLKNDVKKKDEAITNIEKKLKNSDGTKASLKNNKLAVANPRVPKDVISLREKIKLLEGQIKSKEASLEISSATFLEKEKDLQNKIEELASRVEELSRNAEIQKVVKDAGTLTSNEDMCTSTEREDFASELALLEEKNRSMEDELKDMQERYSEISLKFAEVEGERQKLVMTVRYLKNNRKS